jgi:hypothetical protein
MMTKEEAKAFKERWRAVNERIDEEIRNTPTTRKLQQLSSLYNFALTMGWLDRLGLDEEQVWIRWQELRMRYAASTL